MRLPALLLVPLAVAAVVTAPAAAAAGTPTYYLALGDSLSRGYMPGAGDTDQGYADDLYATLKARDPDLQLVKLGCSGETTGTMIDGGRCTDRYPVGSSQLDAAVAFLSAHKGAVTYLTLDIGANDVDGCASGGSIDTACLLRGIGTVTTNLRTILDRLTAADARLPRSIGMTYYDPFLAEWLTGPQGQVVATASVAALVAINSIEVLEYGLYGFRVADVFTAYRTGVFAPFADTPPYGSIPPNVATICRLTYMCTQLNIHPNVQGYQVIADTFAART
jgi:lysophospholipase L1-like esterase